MLDSFIIDRIRRERDRQREQGVLVPLRIEREPPPPFPPGEPARPADHQGPRESPRGSVVIDFQL